MFSNLSYAYYIYTILRADIHTAHLDIYKFSREVNVLNLRSEGNCNKRDLYSRET